jgi:hypothetical protein
MAQNLFKTNLLLQGVPLPPNFEGTPNDFFIAMLQRISIVSPVGFTTFVIGGAKPTTNQGPWLKNGTQWYVWDDTLGDYSPLDITASMPDLFWIQNGTPASFSPPFWIKLNPAETRIEGFYVNGQDGTGWHAVLGGRGTTAQRPGSPVDGEQYYDTDIETLIHWERSQWRTVSGVRGDTKFVSWPTITEALRRNPGWEIFGTGSTDNQTYRGRAIVQATKDEAPGTGALVVSSGISAMAARSIFGEEEHTLVAAEMPKHNHPPYDAGKNFLYVPALGAGTVQNVDYGGTPTAIAIPATGNAGSDDPHENRQPSIALLCLHKT